MLGSDLVDVALADGADPRLSAGCRAVLPLLAKVSLDPDGVTAADFLELVAPLGRTLVQRSTTYEHLAVTSSGEHVPAPEPVTRSGRTRIPLLVDG